MFCFMDGEKLTLLEAGPTGMSYYHCPMCNRVYAYREAAGQYSASMEEMAEADLEEWELTDLGKKLKREK